MTVFDDLGRKIDFERPPETVVSLVPSLTKTLSDLGLGEKLAAVTRFCKYPQELVQTLPKIGGPQKVDTQKILGINPGVVLSVKEENNREQVLQLAEKIPVVVFNIRNIDDALRMITTLGRLFSVETKAHTITSRIKKGLANTVFPTKRLTVLYLIWKKPWMAAGKDTFIGSMLQAAGFENLANGRYPEVNETMMRRASVIMLATEPYPFKEAERKQLAERFPRQKVLIVEGEIFTWFGSYMLNAASYLTKLIEKLQQA